MVLHLNQPLLALAHVSIAWHELDVVVANMVHLTEHPSVLPGEKLVLHVVVLIILLVYVVRPTLNSLRRVYDLWTLCHWIILTAQMDALITHVTFDQHGGHYTATTVTDNVKIYAVVIPFSPEPDPRLPDNIRSVSESLVRVFPDSGATICLGGLSHLNDMGFSTDNLIPSQKVVRTVGNFTLVCRGWLPVRFIVEGKETKQALYILDKVDRIYFSKCACVDVGILSPVFPHPMSCAESELSELHSADPPVGTAVSTCQSQPSVKLPVRPQCPHTPL